MKLSPYIKNLQKPRAKNENIEQWINKWKRNYNSLCEAIRYNDVFGQGRKLPEEISSIGGFISLIAF